MKHCMTPTLVKVQLVTPGRGPARPGSSCQIHTSGDPQNSHDSYDRRIDRNVAGLDLFQDDPNDGQDHYPHV